LYLKLPLGGLCELCHIAQADSSIPESGSLPSQLDVLPVNNLYGRLKLRAVRLGFDAYGCDKTADTLPSD